MADDQPKVLVIDPLVTSVTTVHHTSPSMPPEVRHINARADQPVEIQWLLPDGSRYFETHTCPPKDVRDARSRNAAGQVVSPPHENAAGQKY